MATTTDQTTTTTDEPLNGPKFRATHGAEEWSPAEIDAQQILAELAAYAPAA
jgi:hypothetical protein